MPEWLKRLTKSDIRNSISIITVIGCFVSLFILQFKPIPPENRDIINTVYGFVFGGSLGVTYGYYFAGSKTDKNIKNED
jgi:hypothetical protein